MYFLSFIVLITRGTRGGDNGCIGRILHYNVIFLSIVSIINISGVIDNDSSSVRIITVLYFLMYQITTLLIVSYGCNIILFKDNIIDLLLHIFIRRFPCLFSSTYLPCLLSY